MLMADTPWDEPSDNSPEFRAYLNGELFNYDPWDRIKGQARGECTCRLQHTLAIVTGAWLMQDSSPTCDVDGQPCRADNDGGYQGSPMEHDVRRPSSRRQGYTDQQTKSAVTRADGRCLDTGYEK